MYSKQGCAEPSENVGLGCRFSKNQSEVTSKFKNSKLRIRGSVFKTDFGGLGTVFHVVSQFILQHDRINSQSIFLHAVSLHF